MRSYGRVSEVCVMRKAAPAPFGVRVLHDPHAGFWLLRHSSWNLPPVTTDSWPHFVRFYRRRQLLRASRRPYRVSGIGRFGVVLSSSRITNRCRQQPPASAVALHHWFSIAGLHFKGCCQAAVPDLCRSASSRRRARLSASFPSCRRSAFRPAIRRTAGCRRSTPDRYPPMATYDLALASSMTAHIRTRNTSTHAEQTGCRQRLEVYLSCFS